MQIFSITAKNGLWELTGKQFKTTHNVSDIGVPLERAKTDGQRKGFNHM